MKRQPEKRMRFQSTSFDLFSLLFFFLHWTKRKKSFNYRAAASFNFLRLKEEESGVKKKVTVGVWLWPHKVSVGSGRYNAKKRARRACWRDKKPESWMAVLDFVEPCCLCPLSFWSVFFSLAPNHCPFPFSPTDLMFSKTVGSIKIFFLFLNGAQVCHWNWRSSQSGSRRRDKAR